MDGARERLANCGQISTSKVAKVAKFCGISFGDLAPKLGDLAPKVGDLAPSFWQS